jgi:hypothetical protein
LSIEDVAGGFSRRECGNGSAHDELEANQYAVGTEGCNVTVDKRILAFIRVLADAELREGRKRCGLPTHRPEASFH